MGRGRTSSEVYQPLATGLNVNRLVRELLGRYGEAPDPPRQGETPSRPSKTVVSFYLLPNGDTSAGSYWEEERLGGKLGMSPHLAAFPQGDQLPDDDRVTIDRPDAGTTMETFAQASWLVPVEAMPGG